MNKPTPNELIYRTFEIKRDTEGDIDEKNRTVKLAFSSETPVERWDGMEILDHSLSSVNMSRMKRSAPLLMDHDPRDQVGVIESATIDADRVGRATARFSNSARGQEIFNDVKEGIRSLVSVGYRVNKVETQPGIAGQPDSYRVTNWEPHEISLVSIPADTAVGVGRKLEEKKETMEIVPPTIKKEIKKMENEPQNIEVVRSEASNAGVVKEQKRVTEIFAIADKVKSATVANAAMEFVRSGKTVEAFKDFVLESKSNATPLPIDPLLGMNDREVEGYSLTRAMNCLANRKPLDGLEKECSEAAQKRYGKSAEGFMIPWDVQIAKRGLGKRDLTAGSATAGGDFVQTTVLGSSLIELLRNRMAVKRLGAVTLSGLTGNVAIPSQTAAATAAWGTEIATGSLSAQTIGQLSLTPHRLYALTAYSKQLLAQSTVDVEAFVRNDLMLILAIALDLAAIAGSGASSQPTGILNTSGIGSVTFSGAATWAKMISFETAVATANADVDTMAYLSTAATRGKLKGATKASNYPAYIWENDVSFRPDGVVNGYRAAVSNQVPSDKVVFGNFADMFIADWAGLDIVVDPYTLAANSEVRIVLNMWADIGLRHAASFAASTDSGAQ